ncbi:MAG: hypothetical protein WC209_14510 [Ignavibacteriaceae bacterium]
MRLVAYKGDELQVQSGKYKVKRELELQNKNDLPQKKDVPQ